MNKKTKETLINIGTGKDMTINQFAKVIMKYFNVKLKIKNNKKMPDGVKKKLLDVKLSKKLGWSYKTNLLDGLKKTHEDFLKKKY